MITRSIILLVRLSKLSIAATAILVRKIIGKKEHKEINKHNQ